MFSEEGKGSPAYQEACNHRYRDTGREVKNIPGHCLASFMAVLRVFRMSRILIHAELLPQTVDRAAGDGA